MEVNSVPAWKGLQSVTGIQIADVIAGHMVQCLGLGDKDRQDTIGAIQPGKAQS